MKEKFMREAIKLSREHMEARIGGPFGAVVVHEDKIIGRGWNQVVGNHDPTAHAEIVAIREACQNLGQFHLKDCEMYTNCEPCPMCLGAIYWAHIKAVYYANTRRDATHIGFDDVFIYRQVATAMPLRRLPMHQMMRAEALAVFKEWHNLPHKTVY